MLGQVLSNFIAEVSKEESQASPNYTYFLFEATALTLSHLRASPENFSMVEQQITPALNNII